VLGGGGTVVGGSVATEVAVASLVVDAPPADVVVASLVVDAPAADVVVATEVVVASLVVDAPAAVEVSVAEGVVLGVRVAGGRVVIVGVDSKTPAVASRGRSSPREWLRRPTGSAQAVARLRRHPSGWVSAQVWTESGARRLPPRSTRRLTARIRVACRRGPSIRGRA
jgi:hypothetical protein|tara:strand:- start:157 stop:660 length:504 start_codon:yes stop_codon:yes gene_type:complete